MALVPLLGALMFCPVLGEFGLNLRKCGSSSLSPQWGSYPLVPLIDSCWWERGVCASELVPAKLVWFLRPSLAGGLKVRIVPSTSHVSRKLGPLSPHCVLESPSGEGRCQDGSQVLFPSAPAA